MTYPGARQTLIASDMAGKTRNMYVFLLLLSTENILTLSLSVHDIR